MGTQMSLKGSCLCGSVNYEVEGLDKAIEHCHCRTCRKAHASAYATTAGIMREHFRWPLGVGRGKRAHLRVLSREVPPLLLAVRYAPGGRAPGAAASIP